jgi:phenylacetate-coenzyme A ligase PaaK-like adenylate-forming protein
LIQRLFDKSLYAGPQSKKEGLLLEILSEITSYHMTRCMPYKLMVQAISFVPDSAECLADLPFIPASMFKRLELKSVNEKDVTKEMVSSGTSGQRRSRIFLDAKTAENQSLVLTRIIRDMIGNQRLPMLIVDSKKILTRTQEFSARAAAVRGFIKFGKDHTFALDDDLCIDVNRIQSFLSRHEHESIFVFGFTHMIFEKLLRTLGHSDPPSLNFQNGILLHGGGWKHLESLGISNDEFKSMLKSKLNIHRCHNYYGMVEQTGSIYLECDRGNLHPSVFSDVIIRDPISFKEKRLGEVGLIQSLSVLPTSYPGHSILTEDVGYVKGVDDCGCGRGGKYFEVIGRLKGAEIRGCSNVFAET